MDINIKKQVLVILTLLFCIAITGCNQNKESDSVNDLSQFENAEQVGKNKYVDKNWGHSDDLHNISIMNSTFAVPMMVSDLPEHFTLDTTDDDQTKLIGGYIQQRCNLMLDDKNCGVVTVSYKKDKSLNDGVIISLVVGLFDSAKFKIGELTDRSTKEEVVSVYGEPTHSLKTEVLLQNIYMIDKACSINFSYDCDYGTPLGIQVICIKDSEEKAISNAQYVSYVPPDELSDLANVPKLGTEPKKLDFNTAKLYIDGNPITLPCKLSDFGDDFEIIYDSDITPVEGTDYNNFQGSLIYKDRWLGMVCTSVTKKQKEEDGLIYSVLLTHEDKSKYAVDINFAGISRNSTPEEIKKVYGDGTGKDEAIRYNGLFGDSNNKYGNFIILPHGLISYVVSMKDYAPEEFEKALKENI